MPQLHAAGSLHWGGILISVVSDDFRFSYDVANRLKRFGAPFEHVDPEQGIPKGTMVIIKKGQPRVIMEGSRFTIYGEPEDTSVKAWLVSGGLTDWNRDVFIGIDPGEAPGIAIFSGNTRITTALAPTPESVAFYTRTLSQLVGKKRVNVRIGDGDPTNRDRTIRAVWSTCNQVEMVDERRTSKQAGSDEEAASIIGMTKGEIVKERPEVIPSEGELRNIQRKSRLQSGGHTTISRLLAESVARGEKSMEEAIELQRRAEKGRKASE